MYACTHKYAILEFAQPQTKGYMKIKMLYIQNNTMKSPNTIDWENHSEIRVGTLQTNQSPCGIQLQKYILTRKLGK